MDVALHWNAIYTRPNHEKKVCGLLDKKGIYYCYFENVIAIDNFGQKKTISSALFPSLIFVLLREPQLLSSLLSLPGVQNITYWKSQPAVFPVVEIDLLRNFLEAHKTVEVTKTGLSKSEGIYLQDAHAYQDYSSLDKIYTLHLPSIGYSISAKAEPITNIKLVRKTPPRYRPTVSLAYMLGFKSTSDKFE
jgi:Transcription termination factor nusG